MFLKPPKRHHIKKNFYFNFFFFKTKIGSGVLRMDWREKNDVIQYKWLIKRPVYIVIVQWLIVYWLIIGHLYCRTSFLLGSISSFIVDVKAIFIICLNKKNCSGQIVFVFAMLCTPSLFMLLSLFIFPSLPLSALYPFRFRYFYW